MTTISPASDVRSRPAIVITGASSGIGREIARIAAREKIPLLLIARSNDALLALAKEIESSGTEAACLSLDLCDRDAGEQIESRLASLNWHCTSLVLGAGLGIIGPSYSADRNEQLAVLDINARVLTELALRFLPDMIARRSGGVLTVGSIAGYFPGPNMAVYYATKAYIRSFSNALHAETRGLGVTVTVLSPGFVNTPFWGRSGIGQTRLRKILPSMSAAEVAEVGWRGFKSGRRVVVPGLTNRILIVAAKIMPIGFSAWLIHLLQRQRPPAAPP